MKLNLQSRWIKMLALLMDKSKDSKMHLVMLNLQFQQLVISQNVI